MNTLTEEQEKANNDNHANQLNPNNPEYWNSRLDNDNDDVSSFGDHDDSFENDGFFGYD